MRISANALLDFLRGAITAEEFEPHLRPFRERKPTASALEGQKLNSVRLDKSGDSSDDDYVEFDLVDDLNEKSFKEIAASLKTNS